jgi:hypothetical protein
MTHDHIIAFHIGHSEIRVSEAAKDKDALTDTCCGGVMLLNYCPECGEKLQ